MIELNKIYCENCLETMSRMPNNFIDCTVTSPPYDNLRNYNGYDIDFESIAKELFRVTKKGGVVVWVVGDACIHGSETGTSFKQALYFKEIGFNLHDTMIYERAASTPSNNRYEQDFEFMFILSNGKPNKFNPIQVRKSKESMNKKYVSSQSTTERQKDGSTKGANPKMLERLRAAQETVWCNAKNIWRINAGFMVGSSDLETFKHPATFPEKLAQDHIKSWSNEGDLVYDPFTGSGTTLKMAHLLKRNWIGSEISKEYCDIAQKRIQPYLDQKTLF